MRWRHPVVGEIPPDVFINLAETQQMIVPLTHHLLALIASDAAVLKRILPRGVKLGLNISLPICRPTASATICCASPPRCQPTTFTWCWR